MQRCSNVCETKELNEQKLCLLTKTYNDSKRFGVFINHDISILKIIMAESYALAFPCKFILQCSDLLPHVIQAELFGFIRRAQTLGTFEPVPREYESRHAINFVHNPCYSTTPEQMLRKKKFSNTLIFPK
jgi:hypothetical protein